MILERLKILNIGIEEFQEKKPSKFYDMYISNGLTQQEIDQPNYIPTDSNLVKTESLAPDLTRDKKIINNITNTRYNNKKYIKKKYF